MSRRALEEKSHGHPNGSTTHEGGKPPEVNLYSERFNLIPEHTERQLQKVIDQLNTAGEIGADLVCAGEDIKGEYLFLECYDQPRIFGQLVEEIPGKTSARIAEVARKHKMNVVVTYYERERDEVYNTSVLIDREGTIAGNYRKVHLAPGEARRMSPGRRLPVFTTWTSAGSGWPFATT